MNNNNDIETLNKQQQQQTSKSSKKSNHQSNSINNKSSKSSSKISKQNRPNLIQKQTSGKPTCTRCGFKQLVDITQHEFPKQQGLVFECLSCGNNSIRSNVSADERQRRLAKVAADHLNKVECQFCHRMFHAHNDYLMHLRNDHASNKPM
ncbi:unnamed protein product [Rotaria sp. Silwood2]|nr:unnamed protein product [Rotaria sp. Silwood2]CAF3095114.1 unnamed protein product [Rotaria sp. Silwood2]CAF4430376.1 unnamed protein product [Rotaria sp. Silwood2]CAF4536108.1 unnamed protein product [Rotaria sp. Silwood2]